jgi:hypothetical protein
MESNTKLRTQELLQARHQALKDFASRAQQVGRCFEMPVYQLEHIKMSHELKTVVGNSTRAIWVLENSTPEIPERAKVWDDFEVLGIWSFDQEIVVASSAKLKEVIHRNLCEALKMVMDKSSSSRVLVYNFGNDMNTYIWEECFRDLFISVEL